MLNYANGSLTFCIQLNEGKKPRPIGPNGAMVQITQEEMLDRITSRSEDLVATPGGIVKGKQVMIQELWYHNPYVFIIAKILPEEVASLYKEHEELEWEASVEELKDKIKELKNEPVDPKPVPANIEAE